MLSSKDIFDNGGVCGLVIGDEPESGKSILTCGQLVLCEVVRVVAAVEHLHVRFAVNPFFNGDFLVCAFFFKVSKHSSIVDFTYQVIGQSFTKLITGFIILCKENNS